MATRYRIVQYEGPADWLALTFEKSIIGALEFPDACITAWEAQRGDIVEPRTPFPKEDRAVGNPKHFSTADDLVSHGDQDTDETHNGNDTSLNGD